MVSTISLAVQQKEQQQNMLVLNMETYNYHSYYRLKAKVNHIFIWANWFRMAYCMILILCIQLRFWLPLSIIEDCASSFPAINGSSANYTQHNRALSQPYIFSSMGFIYNIISNIDMEILFISICSVIMGLVIAGNGGYPNLAYDYLDNYRWFCTIRNIFICLALCCIGNQLISALAYRSINILYNFRFISVIIVQIGGFSVCLLFAFLLGIKYASLNHE